MERAVCSLENLAVLLDQKPRAGSVCCPGLRIGLGMCWVPWAHHGSAQQGEGARCRARSFSKVLFGANLFQASYWCSARDVSKGPCLLKELNGSCLQGQKLGCSKQGEGSTLLQREGLCLDFPIPVYPRAHLRVGETHTDKRTTDGRRSASDAFKALCKPPHLGWIPCACSGRIPLRRAQCSPCRRCVCGIYTAPPAPTPPVRSPSRVYCCKKLV